ncbi:hypothetical protein NL676_010999 [Syzygium grande]|nr:hypothetical protein NL676_010999 [Syzygium grande]
MATQLAALAKLDGPKPPSSRGGNRPIRRSRVRHCSEKDVGHHHHYRIESTELPGNTGFGEEALELVLSSSGAPSAPRVLVPGVVHKVHLDEGQGFLQGVLL